MSFRNIKQIEQHLTDYLIYPEVSGILPKNVKSFVCDYLQLKDLITKSRSSGNATFYDWSFQITPIFKALEGVLIHIANGIGLDPKKYNYKLGVIFNEENLEKLYTDVIDKLEDVEELQRTDVKQWLDSARRIMRHFRHTPAHYLGEVQKTRERSVAVGDNALETINQLYKSLLDANVINDGNKEKFIEEIK